MYTYILVLVFSMAVPVIRSFERKHIHFAGKFQYLFPAMLITGAIFVTWDVFFTRWAIWGFTDEYVLGLYIFGLPVEEWLFFIVIPYVCLFSYEVLNYFIRKDVFGPVSAGISWVLLALFCYLVIQFSEQTYTLWVALFDIALLALVGLAWRPVWMGRFYLMFLVITVPFLLVNGVLTGSFIGHTVVWYNPSEIMENRILTIPAEDLFYALGMLLMTTSLYEWFRKRAGKSPWSEARGHHTA